MGRSFSIYKVTFVEENLPPPFTVFVVVCVRVMRHLTNQLAYGADITLLPQYSDQLLYKMTLL